MYTTAAGLVRKLISKWDTGHLHVGTLLANDNARCLQACTDMKQRKRGETSDGERGSICKA